MAATNTAVGRGQHFRACWTVNTRNANATFAVGHREISGPGVVEQDFTRNTGNNYEQVCDPAPKRGGNALVFLQVKSGTVRISSVSLEAADEPTTMTCATGPAITSTNLCLNPATVPAPAVGHGTPRSGSVSYAPTTIPPQSNLVAAFRTECTLSHVSRNDPIVFPGRKDATHWHSFFGNTVADENFTNARERGNSTCSGGTLNRSAYWAPSLIDTSPQGYNQQTRQYNLVPVMTVNDPQNPGAAGRGGNAMQVYYKEGYQGASNTNMEWFPEGLRMIAGGTPSVAPTGPIRVRTPFNQQHRAVWFDCISWGLTTSVWGTEGRDHNVDRIPERCPPGYYIQANIEYPQCGAVNPDGSPVLDSDDHRSHMSYANGWRASGRSGCPASHPKTYPQITQHFRWRVPAHGAAGLKFSSDMYANAQPGWTFHADWWNGWDQATGDTIANNCFRSNSGRGLDCQMNMLGTRHPSGGWTVLQ